MVSKTSLVKLLELHSLIKHIIKICVYLKGKLNEPQRELVLIRIYSDCYNVMGSRRFSHTFEQQKQTTAS